MRMKGLRYQLKSVLKDKFCLMTFLLPIVVAAALNFVGSIDFSKLGEFHFWDFERRFSCAERRMAGTIWRSDGLSD